MIETNITKDLSENNVARWSRYVRRYCENVRILSRSRVENVRRFLGNEWFWQYVNVRSDERRTRIRRINQHFIYLRADATASIKSGSILIKLSKNTPDFSIDNRSRYRYSSACIISIQRHTFFIAKSNEKIDTRWM